MAEETTIDKKTFAVDMKIVWACGLALVYGANMAADWRNRVENHMAQQAAINADIKKTPERVGAIETDVREMKSAIEQFKKSQERAEGKIDELALGLSGFKSSVAREISEMKGPRR
jgi:peptidoglycan hydrolase CwlO-like protein